MWRIIFSISLLMCSCVTVGAKSDYYMQRARLWQRETEYHTKLVQGYVREVDYYNRKVQEYLQEAEIFSKREMYDQVKSYQRRAKVES